MLKPCRGWSPAIFMLFLNVFILAEKTDDEALDEESGFAALEKDIYGDAPQVPASVISYPS